MFYNINPEPRGAGFLTKRPALREAQLIHLLQPPTNRHHRQGPHRQVLLGYAKGGAACCCGAPNCYRREVEAAARVDMPM